MVDSVGQRPVGKAAVGGGSAVVRGYVEHAAPQPTQPTGMIDG